MGPINGKAIFNQKGTRGFSEPRSWRGGKGDDLVSIDYPTHALFTDPYGDLRQDSARPIFTEWMLGSSTWDNPDRWTEDVLKGVRSRLETNKLGIFSPAFARFQEGSGNGDGFSVTRWLGNKPYPKALATGAGMKAISDCFAPSKPFPKSQVPITAATLTSPQEQATMW
jgi:hypothetical protein